MVLISRKKIDYYLNVGYIQAITNSNLTKYFYRVEHFFEPVLFTYINLVFIYEI